MIAVYPHYSGCIHSEDGILKDKCDVSHYTWILLTKEHFSVRNGNGRRNCIISLESLFLPQNSQPLIVLENIHLTISCVTLRKSVTLLFIESLNEDSNHKTIYSSTELLMMDVYHITDILRVEIYDIEKSLVVL